MADIDDQLPLPHFSLPPSDLSQLDRGLHSLDDAVRAAEDAIWTEVGLVDQYLAATLGHIQQTIGRYLRRRLNLLGNAITDLSGGVMAHLDAGLSEVGGQLLSLMSAVGATDRSLSAAPALAATEGTPAYYELAPHLLGPYPAPEPIPPPQVVIPPPVEIPTGDGGHHPPLRPGLTGPYDVPIDCTLVPPGPVPPPEWPWGPAEWRVYVGVWYGRCRGSGVPWEQPPPPIVDPPRPPLPGEIPGPPRPPGLPGPEGLPPPQICPGTGAIVSCPTPTPGQPIPPPEIVNILIPTGFGTTMIVPLVVPGGTIISVPGPTGQPVPSPVGPGGTIVVQPAPGGQGTLFYSGRPERPVPPVPPGGTIITETPTPPSPSPGPPGPGPGGQIRSQTTGEGIQPPGTFAFCAAVSSILQVVEEAGQGILGIFSGESGGALNLGDIAGRLLTRLGVPEGIAGLVALALQAADLGPIGHGVLQQVGLIGQAIPLRHGNLLGFVWVCKAFVRSLESLMVGLNFVGWATASIKIELSSASRVLDFLEQYIYPTAPLSPNDAISAYLRGEMGIDQTLCLCQLGGLDRELALVQIRSARWRPSPGEYYAWTRRAETSEAETQAGLGALGVIDPAEQALVASMHQMLPTPSDLVHFMARDADDERVVEEFGYDEEFEDKYGAKMRYWGKATGISDEVMRYHWRSHYQLISPTQGYEMLHRLRPGRVDYYREQLQALGDAEVNLEAFTLPRLRRILGVADYAPGVRDYLAAIAFTPLRLVDIRNAYGLRVPGVTKEWMIDQMMDRGLTRADAELSVGLVDRQIEAKRRAPIRSFEQSLLGQRLKAIMESYEDGLLDDQEAQEALINAGVSAEAAKSAIEIADMRYALSVVAEGARGIRSRLAGGDIDDGQARELLQGLGLGAQAANKKVDLWRIGMGERQQRATSERILRWARRGLITPREARERLRRLGWRDEELLVTMSELEQDLRAAEAKGMASAERTREQQARALEAAQAKARQVQQRARQELARLTPVSKLQAWAKKGIISEPFFRARMGALGYPGDTISQYWMEATGDEPEGEEGG